MLAKYYDAVVIGTGFGGAVSACRLSQAGLKVAVFERGRRYGYNQFPRNWEDPLDGWLWEHNQGLFDVKPISEMMIVQSAGYGGGSLIYANVQLRVPPDGFAKGWPDGYSREMLDPYYDLVAHMLDVNPIRKTEYNDLPPKTLLMQEVAEKLGRKDQFFYPNIAVNLGDPSKRTPNKFGVDQSGCTYCGECDIGCNNHAKNSLDLNYLAIAEKHADVALRTEVLKIEPSERGYRVHYRDHESGIDGAVEAAAVFVCAGAVNSTELLLRCREQYHTLPNISPALGRRYSGNGDYLAFSFDTKTKFYPSRGPTITTSMVYDHGTADARSWFVFQEGGYPKQISSLLQILNPKTKWAHEVHQAVKDDLERDMIALSKRQIEADGWREHDDSAVFLAMGRDLANGSIHLLPLTHKLCVRWDVPSNMPLYSAEERFSRDIAGALEGEMGYNPFWKLLHQPVAVHNLGGCVMADHPADGVVNAEGEVYGYKNMFVLDGAALPAATGANPSHTIAAVAERNVERFIRRRLNDPTWQAPERAVAKKIIEPLNNIRIPKDGTLAPTTQSVGITFTETMRGFLTQCTTPPASLDDYVKAESKGKIENRSIEFTLTITLADVDLFLADKDHGGIAVGTLRADGFTASSGAPVTNGVFNLFEDSESVYARKMIYVLPFYSTAGEPYLLDAYKDVRDHGALDIWESTSTLYTVIRAGHDREGHVVAAGVLHILKKDFAHQMTTLRTIGTSSPLAQADALSRFSRMFLGTLFDVFVRPRLE